MKAITFLMAVYILVLSIIPCNDMHNECNDTKTKKELAQNHDHQQDQDDHCSPFCSCTCCSASVVALEFAHFQFKELPVLSTSEKKALRNFSFVSGFSGNIWQPPRIG